MTTLNSRSELPAHAAGTDAATDSHPAIGLYQPKAESGDANVTTSIRWAVHHVDGETLYASRANRIGKSTDGGRLFQTACHFPIPTGTRLRKVSRVLRRLFREEIRHVVPVGEHLVIFGYKQIATWHLTEQRWLADPQPTVGAHPLNVCVTREGSLLYGEYRRNPERSPTHIWRSDNAGVTWEPVWQSTTIRHVHGVHLDPFTNDLWITTGDTDPESQVLRTSDQFRTVEPIWSGSQQVRVVDLLFTRDDVIFGSDTPLERNHVYVADRSTLKPEAVAEVDSSVFFARTVNGTHYLTTAIEPSTINPGNFAALWKSNDGYTWERVRTFPATMWPTTKYQWGQLRFPTLSPTTEQLWFSTWAVRPDELSFQHSPER